MGKHNVVITTMPETGTHKAATVATQLLNDFPSIRFGLLVGIGGGIPSADVDIRLGDVVVSKPTGNSRGVIQFDRGKTLKDGKFLRTGSLAGPPSVLSAHVAQLSGVHQAQGNQIKTFLSKLNPRMKERGYTYQDSQQDLLFRANYTHPGEETCEKCDITKLAKRYSRNNDIPEIHYGTIGSSNSVIKDSEFRDKLKKELGIICVEMEAAGLMDDFPCLVIRGICDYADTHKNDHWQCYAAATAAAYAKELLSTIPSAEIATASVAIQDGM
jgi:nucleoside phosphorylase